MSKNVLGLLILRKDSVWKKRDRGEILPNNDHECKTVKYEISSEASFIREEKMSRFLKSSSKLEGN